MTSSKKIGTADWIYPDAPVLPPDSEKGLALVEKTRRENRKRRVLDHVHKAHREWMAKPEDIQAISYLSGALISWREVLNDNS